MNESEHFPTPRPSRPHRGASIWTKVVATAAVALAAAFGAPDAALAQADIPSAGKRVKVSPNVYEIAVRPSSGTVYVASTGPRGENAAVITVLDGETLDTEGTIALGELAAYGLGLDDRAGILYGTDSRNGAVLVVDLASNSLVHSVTNPEDESGHLREVIVDETTGRAYASSYGEEGMIWVVDGRSGTILNTFHDVGNGTSGLALDREGGRLFATNISGGDVAVVDLASGDVVRTFDAGGERPTNVVFDSVRDRVWVANQGTNDVTVLDAETGSLLGAVPTGEGALGVSLNLDEGLVYVANRQAGTVTVVDAVSMEVIANLQTGSHPNTVAVDPSSDLAYVTNKAQSAGRGQPPVDDPNGDVVTVIRP